MASIVSAGTTSATALNMSADTTGILQLASNNGTVALTIDTSQNVGFGTASPTQPLTVFKAYNGATWINVVNTTSGTGSSTGLLMTTDSSIQATIELDSTAFSSFANALRIRQIGAYPIVFSTTDSERLRITSNGLILAGSSSVLSGQGGSARIQSTGNIAISGTDGELILSNSGSDPRTWRILSSTGGGITARLRFYDDNAGAERMSITKDGDFYVGTTTGTINTSNKGFAVSGGDGEVRLSRLVGASSPVFNVYGSQGEARIMGDGDLENTNNRYTGISDIKFKQNIVDAKSQWADIKAIQVRNYELVDYPERKQIGCVAQELEQVCPHLVIEREDADGETYKSVAYSVLYMKAVKALQEAMERIEQSEVIIVDLKARIETLENK